ncbi:hypothetical protein [Hymenobacter sp. IS2118]|uniref:hypothetical protein n=1 Tax=Hymenobacter sp. IS2118 TaxID=1505605 RepID=UPI000550FCBB|nr:hypothetical protein [Hymenobacter sp. IS2118]
MPATISRQFEADFIPELASRYIQQGYKVRVGPPATAVPFDLRGYRPDLLAEKEDEHLLIEVKGAQAPIPIERLQELILTVRQHPGWRFLLVTPDRPEPVQHLRRTTELLPWASARARAQRAQHLLATGDSESAFLLAWAALETLLRRHAEAQALPFDQLADLSLLRQLYSFGHLSIPHYDFALEALTLRDELTHGFQPTQPIEPAANQLLALLNDLLQEWAAEASPAA